MSSMAGEQWTIQVNRETQDWVSEVDKEVKNLRQLRLLESKQWKEWSIYRIPWSIRKLNRTAYQPQMVSIGPYHHGAAQLEGMERHKRRAVLNLVERSQKPLHCYAAALADVVEELQDAYDQLQPKWKQDRAAFLRLMLHDGCFILELMRTTTCTATSSKLKQTMSYDCCDPVFSDHGKLYSVPHLHRDMLKLENQIPLQVLKIILTVEASSTHSQSHDQLTELIMEFLGRPREKTHNIQELGKCLHILDLYRKSLLISLPTSSGCREKAAAAEEEEEAERGRGMGRRFRKTMEEVAPWLNKRNKEEEYDYNDNNIPSATKLTEAGIQFKKSETSNLDDVAFSHRRGVLELPRITVDDATESVYLNLMALERCHVDAGNGVSDYVYMMDRLIDSARDVSQLHWDGIIDNSLGSDEAVADLFNSLSTDVCIESRSTLGVVRKRLTRYYRAPVQRCMAYAKHNYFTNPWVTLSIVAAIFLFALAILQTVYAILSYFQDQKNTK